MTEWDAAEYSRRSSLQEAMAQEVLALLDLNGSERILDVGCGDGKITAQIASRASKGSVVGVDPSRDMIRSEEHTSELQSQSNLVCRLLLEKKKKKNI